MLTDLEISQKSQKYPITDIAKNLNLMEDEIDQYVKYIAKISSSALQKLQQRFSHQKEIWKLILVTAITPTSAWEGKSTVSIWLADWLRKIWKKSVLALREPSLWPCFWIKWWACWWWMAQIVPMEKINLHFTGDLHAITSANNLISAIIDNHIYHGNELQIDPKTITRNRCIDLNDRFLRKIKIWLWWGTNGIERDESFCITAASEIMAILCLSQTLDDLRNRIDNIIIGKDIEGNQIFFRSFQSTWAIVALLEDALRPNLVQTLEWTPAFVHGGPFANIAHGCNSINATICALATWEYVVTEAWFGADLWAEKFFDIKCQLNHLKPDACVIVATIRALKMHGGISKENLNQENIEALKKGFENLRVHIDNIQKFWMKPLVAINKFISDTPDEIFVLQSLCKELGVQALITECREKWGDGAIDLANAVCDSIQKGESDFSPLYNFSLPLETKIKRIATEIYHAKEVIFSDKAKEQITLLKRLWYDSLPVCIAKTQNSLSHDKKLLWAPQDYSFPIRELKLYHGAWFIVALSGNIITMPWLPKEPASMNIDFDTNGLLVWLS